MTSFVVSTSINAKARSPNTGAANSRAKPTSKERLGDSDRGVIAYRQVLREQLARVEAGEEPINVFHDPVQNERIDLPVPWDRGHAWGFDKDGSYKRGAVTASDRLPEHIAEEIEDLYVEAAKRKNMLVGAK